MIECRSDLVAFAVDRVDATRFAAEAVGSLRPQRELVRPLEVPVSTSLDGLGSLSIGQREVADGIEHLEARGRRGRPADLDE